MHFALGQRRPALTIVCQGITDPCTVQVITDSQTQDAAMAYIYLSHGWYALTLLASA